MAEVPIDKWKLVLQESQSEFRRFGCSVVRQEAEAFLRDRPDEIDILKNDIESRFMSHVGGESFEKLRSTLKQTKSFADSWNVIYTIEGIMKSFCKFGHFEETVKYGRLAFKLCHFLFNDKAAEISGILPYLLGIIDCFSKCLKMAFVRF